jgi:hypothetical protein
MPENEVIERTAEEKAQMYSALLGSVSVITNVIDDDNDFCNDLDAAGKKERTTRSAGYLSMAVALDDWGDEDMSTVNAAISAADAYSPS